MQYLPYSKCTRGVGGGFSEKRRLCVPCCCLSRSLPLPLCLLLLVLLTYPLFRTEPKADEALREAQAFAPVTTYASSEIKKMIKAVTKLDLGKAGGIMKIDTNSIQIKDDTNPFGN